ncbi:type IV pilus twitching motility protein PilT [Planctomycetales bacterium ZRK34]|nr:type IV pilus twitching motility protein PilT [Planctomycetales bacterium ZRK34]
MSTVQIDRLLETVVKQGASDLHLTVGKPPTLRLHGHLRELKTKVLDADDTVALMKSISPERSQQELQEVGGCDFGFAYGEKARFRVAIFRQRGHLALVLRQIPNKLLGLDQIGLPTICRDLIRRPRGLFLVTGPTGSGKSTSLAAMINNVNENLDRHIITIEDPIEYYHPHKKSIVNQREIGADCPTFSEGLRRALRQDPDVILVGEMRDLETIEAAIQAAETGHLVFGTLHTNSAGGTINRIIDAFPNTQQAQIRVQLSTSLMAVLSQALMPRCDTNGMVAAYEFMLVTPAIANLIREGKPVTYIDSAIQTGRKFGMRLLDDHLWSLYQEGKISAEDMVDKAREPSQLVDKVHRAGGTINRAELDDPEAAGQAG